MMEIGTYNIMVKDVVNKLTLRVRVRGVACARARVWLGEKIIRLGAWVTGCKCEIDLKESE